MDKELLTLRRREVAAQERIAAAAEKQASRVTPRRETVPENIEHGLRTLIGSFCQFG